MSIKLSIIIPVYNVERYIKKCLYSCLAQDISPDLYEIIVVNDGSPDNSIDIIRPIAAEYSNVRVYTQENKGLSEARNFGFKESKGEYVWFVDSDDWINENCLGEIFNSLVQKIDILQIQYQLTYDDESCVIPAPLCSIKGIKSGKEVMLSGGLPVPAQFCIYRSAFLKDNNLHFVKGILHEDSEFKPRAVYLAERIASLDGIVCYNYYQRTSGNITSLFSLKRAQDIIFINKSLYDFAKDKELRFRIQFYRYISENMNSLLFGIHSLPLCDRDTVIHSLKRNKLFFKCMCKSLNLKYFIEGLVLYINVSMGLFFHKVIRL